MRKTSNITKHDFTQNYNFIKGNFELSKISIPYYMFSMPLYCVADDLSLVSDLHKMSLELFDVNNVFQRNIDTKRVEDDIVRGYLNDTEKIKFFNPLTIAFIPNNNDQIIDKYEILEIPNEILKSIVPGTEETVEDYFSNTKNLSNIVLMEEENSDLGMLRWDKKSVNAIAIDGQHRLSALKIFYSNNPDKKDVLIPIIAIVFDDFSDKTLISYLREIFIDINKSAKPVKQTRNIILDDRDVSAMLTKELIFSDYKSQEENTDSLMSEVFDWQSDDPRPESSFQVTSIVIIYRIISESFLERKELRSNNSWDSKKIISFVNMLNRKFNVDKKIKKNEDTLQYRAKATIEREGTFSLTKQQIKLIVESFRESIKPLFHKVFNEFGPYKQFMDISHSLKMFEKDTIINNYIRIPKQSRENYLKEYHAKLSNGMIEGDNFLPDEIFKDLINLKKDNLLFNIIGQLAIFRVIEKEIYTLAGKYNLEDFFEAINYILAKENIFNKYYKVEDRFLWDSLATQNKGTKISATSVSIDNISDILVYLMIIYTLHKKESLQIDSDLLMSGRIEYFGKSDAPQNIFIEKLSTKLITRLAIEQKNIETSYKSDVELRALAKVTLKNFIEQIIKL